MYSAVDIIIAHVSFVPKCMISGSERQTHNKQPTGTISK